MPRPYDLERSGPFKVSYDAFSQRPLIAAAIGDVITSCVWQEVYFSIVTAVALGIENKVAFDVYQAISNDSVRQRAFNTAVDKRLTDAERATLKALRARFQPVKKVRDGFAHGIWGVSDTMPDALILTSSDRLTQVLATRQPGAGAEGTVYELADIQKLKADLLGLMLETFGLAEGIRARDQLPGL